MKRCAESGGDLNDSGQVSTGERLRPYSGDPRELDRDAHTVDPTAPDDNAGDPTDADTQERLAQRRVAPFA